ncbi:MAG TPA: hypothetical protein VKN76_15345 [Kiloniellaceae bacterium]|nr:hypothetical protein [Kiloniellaceae bacterium]
MNHLDALDRRFPGQALAIRRRLRSDASFKELCMDHKAAADALAYWLAPPRQSEQRAADYRALLAEIEKDIADALAG